MTNSTVQHNHFSYFSENLLLLGNPMDYAQKSRLIRAFRPISMLTGLETWRLAQLSSAESNSNSQQESNIDNWNSAFKSKIAVGRHNPWVKEWRILISVGDDYKRGKLLELKIIKGECGRLATKLVKTDFWMPGNLLKVQLFPPHMFLKWALNKWKTLFDKSRSYWNKSITNE